MTRIGGLAVVPLLVLAGCGDGSTASSESPSAASNELTFTRADGSTFTVEPTSVSCGPPESEVAPANRLVVRVRQSTKQHNLVIEAVLDDVKDGRKFMVPVDEGEYDDSQNAILFYGSKEYEVSSSEEEGAGTLEILKASCDPAGLELRIDATLGSEISDDGKLKVKGHLDLGE